jgi:anti-sigma regulatory factor (Ser/Thr protein kinase)
MEEGFRHEALMYAGEHEFVGRTAAFVRDSLEAGEPILVMVTADKIEHLRAELNGETEHVEFADMSEIGRNPARIIPAWREFAARNAGRKMRVVGEPIWAERNANELVECQHHESLINAAFTDAEGFRLVCPYDTQALPDWVIQEAYCSHPAIVDGDDSTESVFYRGHDHAGHAFGDRLPEPPTMRHLLRFETFTLSAVRRFTERRAARAGLREQKKDDVVLAVNELATNSVRHAGGHGVVRSWRQGDALLFEVSDRGRINEPLVGRKRPDVFEPGGQGLFLVNQICDLVQVRSSAAGTVVRLHVTLD